MRAVADALQELISNPVYGATARAMADIALMLVTVTLYLQARRIQRLERALREIRAFQIRLQTQDLMRKYDDAAKKRP